MSNTYRLVNPYVQGEVKTNIKAKNSITAAKKLYRSISEHFNNSVPKFYFTIQKGSSGKGKYYHFEVKEKRSGEEVSYSIQPYSIRSEKTTLKKFESKLNLAKKNIGGKKKRKSKKKDDSDSSDTDSSDYYKRSQQYVPTYDLPIWYWWYDPYVYRLDYVNVPTFYSYVTPYIEILTHG